MNMRCFTDRHEPGAITGKPLQLGGSAGRSPATAMGGMFTIREAGKLLGMELDGATAAIQGYGNVGSFAHRLGHDRFGMKVVAVSDEFGGIYNDNGLDPTVVAQHLRRTGKVAGCPETEEISNSALLELDVDILIPAAIENQLTGRMRQYPGPDHSRIGQWTNNTGSGQNFRR